MKSSRRSATADRQHGRRRSLLGTAIAVALCLMTSACGSLFDDSDSDTASTERGQRAHGTPSAKSVRAFYARASRAYRVGDARQLCRMMQPRYAETMVEEASAGGIDVSTCPEMWKYVFEFDPEGYKDKIRHVEVKGRTATFLSGDDPWRLRFVRGEWMIVDPG